MTPILSSNGVSGKPGEVHNAESALSRLATCAMQGETDLPWEVTCRGVVDGISMVIHMTRREGKRYVEEALHVGDYDAAKRRWHYRPVAFADPQLKLARGAVMPDNAARTMRQRRAGIISRCFFTGSRIQRGKESRVNSPLLAGPGR